MILDNLSVDPKKPSKYIVSLEFLRELGGLGKPRTKMVTITPRSLNAEIRTRVGC